MHYVQQSRLTDRCRLCDIMGMTKLAKHLKNEGMTQRAFAALIETDTSVVSRFIHRQARPGLALAVKIARLTNGAVPVDTWIKPQTETAATQ